MSTSDLDALAQLINRDPATFSSLPLPLAQRIFLALPADARGRASCVCRGWRDTLAEPALWTRLNMSVVRVELPRFIDVLRGAAGRALGQLCQLELSQQYVAWDVLLPVLTANAASLRELHLNSVCAVVDMHALPPVEAVVAAAPLLQVLTAERMWRSWEHAPRVLRAEPPFAPLQMRGVLTMRFDGQLGRVGGMECVGSFAAALADAALQPALLHVCVQLADVSQLAVMGALADAALARRLRELTLQYCTPPAAAPLARLLAGGSLAVLEIDSRASAVGTPLCDAAGAALVADALRVNTTLTKLDLYDTFLYGDARAAELLLGALTGHHSLRELHINEADSTMHDCSAFGGALGALIAADAPALLVINCSGNSLGDAGLAPIVDALTRNCHLRELDLSRNGMSEAFARERLLPAVRANISLRELLCVHEGDEPVPAAAEAEELVCLREQHG